MYDNIMKLTYLCNKSHLASYHFKLQPAWQPEWSGVCLPLAPALLACFGPGLWSLLGPLLTAGLPVLEAALPQRRRYARHAFQGLLDCRADFLAPLPLFAWLLCASSQERINIRILRHIEMCPTTNSLSLFYHPHQNPTSLPDTTPITVKQLHRRESVRQRL